MLKIEILKKGFKGLKTLFYEFVIFTYRKLRDRQNGEFFFTLWSCYMSKKDLQKL